jgi:hypothetical protein
MNKKEKPRLYQIIFRVSKNVYNDLELYARTKKNKVNGAARSIVEEFLSPQNENIQHKAIINMYEAQKKGNMILEYIAQFIPYYMNIHYSSHPQTPEQFVETNAANSAERAQKSMELYSNQYFMKHGSILELIFADLHEERPS